MSDADMGHMAYLRAVARGDVEHLKIKEATYRGSWKRRGGVGAYMMMARKWDRLEGIVSKTYDVFSIIGGQCDADKAIRPNEPVGSDGTVLAEIRDLRRYLLLVEAEMAARGAVTGYELDAASTRPEITEHVPDKLDEITSAIDALVPEMRDLRALRYSGLRKGVVALLRLVHHEEEVVAILRGKDDGYGVGPLITQHVPEQLAEETDFYAARAIEWNCTRQEAKDRVAKKLFGSTLERGDEIEADFYRLKGQEWAVSTEQAKQIVEKTLSTYAMLTRHSLGIVSAADRVHKTKDQLVARLRELDEKYPQWGGARYALDEERKEIMAALLREHDMSFVDVEAARRGDATPPGTPEDGGHHESRAATTENADDERRVPRHPRSDETEPRDGLTEQPRWWGFVRSFDEIDGIAYYNVDRHTTTMPRPTMLRRELNNKEHELTEPYYRGMYEWSTRGEGKFVLRSEYLEKWGK
jgi:hypothetical protein